MKLWIERAHLAGIALIFKSIIVIVEDILWSSLCLSLLNLQKMVPIIRPPLLISVKIRVLFVDSFKKILHLAASVVILVLVLGRNAQIERII